MKYFQEYNFGESRVPRSKTNIYITGFMGSGKTTYGKRLAKKVKREFIDLDEYIEKKEKKKIYKIFEEHGEMAFRKLEEKYLGEAALLNDKIVALGGGTLISKKNLKKVQQSGTLIYLKSNYKQFKERILEKVKEKKKRPLVKMLNKNTYNNMYELRKRSYEKAQIHLNDINLGDSSLIENLFKKEKAKKVYKDNMNNKFFFKKTYSTSVIFDNYQKTLNGLLKEKGSSKKVIFVDDTVKTLDRSFFNKISKKALVITVKSHESSKSLKSLINIVDHLSSNNIDKRSLFIAIGGGVVGDLVGFISAIYMRGVDYVMVPTTLLSMVDAGFGGKNGVNFKKSKNLLGQIKQPTKIIVDIRFLNTLPKKEVRSGLGEIAKYALLTSQIDFLTKIDNANNLKQVIQKCIQYKMKLVLKDEEDVKGIRQLLNLGHTFGHALEAYSGYKGCTHGEAVLWGLKFALLVSRELKLLSSANYLKLSKNLEVYDYPKLPHKLDAKKLYLLALKDKKSVNSNVKMVLLRKRGQPAPNIKIPRETFLKCVRYL